MEDDVIFDHNAQFLLVEISSLDLLPGLTLNYSALKSMPTVLTNADVKLSSAYLNWIYCMYKKSWPILNITLLQKIGQHFLDIQ